MRAERSLAPCSRGPLQPWSEPCIDPLFSPVKPYPWTNFAPLAAVLLLASALPAFPAAPEVTTAPSTGGPSPAGVAVLPPDDARFAYAGRFDRRDPRGPVVIWQASRIAVGFSGDAVVVRFSDLHGQVFFNATVDGKTTVLALPEHSKQDRFLLNGYGPGAHQLVLFKRSEANAGWVRFRGLELIGDTKPLAAVTKPHGHRILFIGDSITVGACNEDGPVDQWEDRRTHNAALSYAALAAEAVRADYQNISVSGMGVVLGWVPQLAGETWDRVYPDPQSAKADLSDFTPEVVFVNLGENDASRSAALHQAFPATFADKYIELGTAVRHAYPRAQIVLLRGGMAGGATNADLRVAWEAALQGLQRAGPGVHGFVFKHWSHTHPRVPDDRAMAAELSAWLLEQGFWTK